MVHARHLERYPVLQVDWRDRGFFADPAAPRPDDSLRAAWAGEALAAAWPDGGPFADRLALLDLCNPCALDGDVPGSTRAVLPLGGVIKALFLTLVEQRIAPGVSILSRLTGGISGAVKALLVAERHSLAKEADFVGGLRDDWDRKERARLDRITAAAERSDPDLD